MKRMCFLSLALAAALTAGCRGDDRSATTAKPEAGSPVGTSGAADISRSDRDFVKDAAIANMAEIDLGRIALEKGADANVKKFAQMMIDDHTKALDALKTVATETHVEMPAQVDDDHREKAEKIGSKSGMDFDRDYAEMMVDGHENFVNTLESRMTVPVSGRRSTWAAWARRPSQGRDGSVMAEERPRHSS